MSKFRTILMFGAPGSGKGTQGKVIGDLPGYFHLSCGDVFRALKHDSELGDIFLKHSRKGELVPDEFTVQLWQEHIHRQVGAHRFHPESEILILDGIPRNTHQAQILETHIKVINLIYLEAMDEEQMIERLHRRALHENRLDDAKETVIRKRFEEYDRESRPVLDFYAPELIHRIDAGGSPIEVLARTVEGVLAAQGSLSMA
ncbi:MAG: adenylate kinase [Candidatus Latescibacterota bacterium]|jgi:adenylate kinase